MPARASQPRWLLRALPWSEASGTFYSFNKHVTCTHVCQGLRWLLGGGNMGKLAPSWSLGLMLKGSPETQTPRPPRLAEPSSIYLLLIFHHHRKHRMAGTEEG